MSADTAWTRATMFLPSVMQSGTVIFSTVIMRD